MSRYSRNFEESVSGSFWRTPKVTSPVSKSCVNAGRVSARRAIARMKVLVFMASSSAPEVRRGRSVAAVHVLVAVLARMLGGTVARPGELAGGVDVAVERAGMARVQVAALAQPRLLRHEHLVVVRAVRVVAVEAVLPDRGVLPEERAALLRMALEAQLVGHLGLDHLGLAAVVGVVAAAARHQAFTHGVMRRPERLRADRGVARVAGVGLLRRLELALVALERMHRVAVGARDAAPVVHAADPRRVALLLVTLEARGVDVCRLGLG